MQAASSTAGVAELLPSTEEAASALKEATVPGVPTATRMANAVGSMAATAEGGAGGEHVVRTSAGGAGGEHVVMNPLVAADADEATSSKHVV